MERPCYGVLALAGAALLLLLLFLLSPAAAVALLAALMGGCALYLLFRARLREPSRERES